MLLLVDKVMKTYKVSELTRLDSNDNNAWDSQDSLKFSPIS